MVKFLLIQSIILYLLALFDIDKTLTKEQVETLYDLVLRGLDFYEHLGVDTEKLLKGRA